MEGKSGVVLAVENPFFEDAEIIHINKDMGNIVFSKPLGIYTTKPGGGPPGYDYLCITDNGLVNHCFEGKHAYGKGYPTYIRMTKGIVDILSFLHEKASLIKQNGDHSTNTLDTIYFVVELIVSMSLSQISKNLFHPVVVDEYFCH